MWACPLTGPGRYAFNGHAYRTAGLAARPEREPPNRFIYALTDSLGSTRTLLDFRGAVVRQHGYQPYLAVGRLDDEHADPVAGGENDGGDEVRAQGRDLRRLRPADSIGGTAAGTVLTGGNPTGA